MQNLYVLIFAYPSKGKKTVLIFVHFLQKKFNFMYKTAVLQLFLATYYYLRKRKIQQQETLTI